MKKHTECIVNASEPRRPVMPHAPASDTSEGLDPVKYATLIHGNTRDRSNVTIVHSLLHEKDDKEKHDSAIDAACAVNPAPCDAGPDNETQNRWANEAARHINSMSRCCGITTDGICLTHGDATKAKVQKFT